MVTLPRTLGETTMPHADRNTDAVVFLFVLLVSELKGLKKFNSPNLGEKGSHKE